MFLLVEPQVVEGAEGGSKGPFVIVCQISDGFKGGCGFSLEPLELREVRCRHACLHLMANDPQEGQFFRAAGRQGELNNACGTIARTVVALVEPFERKTALQTFLMPRSAGVSFLDKREVQHEHVQCVQRTCSRQP